MRLIVCLGNVGKEYDKTRHNIGFMVADYLESNFTLETKFRGYVYQANLNGEKYIMVKPTTFMNESGLCVKKIVDYYDIQVKDILVVQDDMDMDLGTYKLKRNSSSGGHNGIKSIIKALDSEEFLRLKVGIGHNRNVDTIDYVLGHFSKSEIELLESNFPIYKKLIECFILNGVEKTLQDFSKGK